MKALCPICNHSAEIDDSLAGTTTDCPSCSNKFKIPDILEQREIQTQDYGTDSSTFRWRCFLVFFGLGLIFFLGGLIFVNIFRYSLYIRLVLFVIGCGCFVKAYCSLPISRHYLEWMHFCSKYLAILFVIIGARVGWKSIDSATDPNYGAAAIVNAVLGAGAGFLLGAIIGNIVGVIVARFTRDDSYSNGD